MSERPDRHTAPHIAGFGKFDIPRPTSLTLANGTTLYVLDRGDIPVCRLTACWNAGRADMPSIPALVVATNAMRCGTTALSEDEIAEVLEFNGAWLRCNADNHSSFVTLYSLNKTFGKVIPIVADMLRDAALESKVLDSQRSKTAAQVDIKNRRVNVKAEYLYNELFYGPESPLARHYNGAEVLATSDNEIRVAYQRLYRGVKPTFFLAGRISDTILDNAIEALGEIPFGEVPNPAERVIVPAPPHNASFTSRAQDDESLQTAIKIGLPTIGRDHPDFDKLRVAVMLLGGYFGSRLMTNIREDKGYTYGITAALNGAPEGAAVEIACQTDNRFTHDVLAEIDKEIAKLANEPVPDEELESARNILISSMAGVTDTPFSIADYLVTLHTLDLGPEHFGRQLEAVRAVTPAEINRLTAEYIASAPKITALAGNFK